MPSSEYRAETRATHVTMPMYVRKAGVDNYWNRKLAIEDTCGRDGWKYYYGTCEEERDTGGIM